MNETTKALLLKVRKGATAGFETKQWQEVLMALGFGFEITKFRNTVTEVRITSKLGACLTIVKERDSRRVSYYKLGSWLKSLAVEQPDGTLTTGYDLVAASSAALGMDTPEVERQLKDLYIRDLTNTGTCAVCGGNYKRHGEGIGHHGFQRPGDGQLYGSCFAVGYLPWELSPEGAQAYIDKCLVPRLHGCEQYLTKLRAGEIKKLHVQRGWGKHSRVVEITPESGEFDQELKSSIHKYEAEIKSTKYSIETFTAKVAGWKLDELPEIKHAGKFKVA